ncbi:hypothetical protein WMY93_015088 [Mugilogobius chulae]|uniref:Uncharacterized protein n=1 Tax=Mugilogobius chulae TaxID=88201 RepID=A0AAW0NX73_9GOBI
MARYDYSLAVDWSVPGQLGLVRWKRLLLQKLENTSKSSVKKCAHWWIRPIESKDCGEKKPFVCYDSGRGGSSLDARLPCPHTVPPGSSSKWNMSRTPVQGGIQEASEISNKKITICLSKSCLRAGKPPPTLL